MTPPFLQLGLVCVCLCVGFVFVQFSCRQEFCLALQVQKLMARQVEVRRRKLWHHHPPERDLDSAGLLSDCPQVLWHHWHVCTAGQRPMILEKLRQLSKSALSPMFGKGSFEASICKLAREGAFLANLSSVSSLMCSGKHFCSTDFRSF